MLTALVLGLSYGLTAGVSPGPMLGLVIAQTLRHGRRAGQIVALAPLGSDLPIIVVMVLLLNRLPATAFGWLGIVGGGFVLLLAWQTWRGAANTPTTSGAANATPGHVLGSAVLTNLLNPHPYLFWGTAGAAVLLRLHAGSGWVAVLLFLVGFYGLLVGSKLAIAAVVHRSRGWLAGRGYQRLLRATALLLVLLGGLLLRDAVMLLAGVH